MVGILAPTLHLRNMRILYLHLPSQSHTKHGKMVKRIQYPMLFHCTLPSMLHEVSHSIEKKDLIVLKNLLKYN